MRRLGRSAELPSCDSAIPGPLRECSVAYLDNSGVIFASVYWLIWNHLHFLFLPPEIEARHVFLLCTPYFPITTTAIEMFSRSIIEPGTCASVVVQDPLPGLHLSCFLRSLVVIFCSYLIAILTRLRNGYPWVGFWNFKPPMGTQWVAKNPMSYQEPGGYPPT
jgi:hypothetical protein